MGRDHVVTDRDTLRERPPDILLTNYKMLDYSAGPAVRTSSVGCANSLPAANDREALGVLNGLCALISVARRREGTGGGGALRPFLQVGLHLWVRELRRMVCSLYEDATYLFPAAAPPGVPGFDVTVCGACGMVHQAADVPSCTGCGSERLVRVFQPLSVEPRGRGDSRSTRLSRNCPYCGASEALIIVGARAASLLSVALGQAQGSRYNDDRKVIAFSDNVQDAAHRAGFFAARTAGTAVRSAIAQVVDRNDGIALADLPERVETWWRDKGVNPAAFDDERFVSEFIAPDRLWRRDFVTLQREGRLPAGSRLPGAGAERLRWDTLAELDYRSAIGRTLERTRAAAVGADREALERACRGAHLRIREQ